MNAIARRLFARRLRRYYRIQYRIWRSALDWTVALYILFPGLFIMGGTYRSWWQQPPDWLLDLPAPLAAIMLLATLWMGSLRTFAEEADVLSLRQQPAIMHRLAGYGILYTILVRLVITAGAFGILSIWLLRVLNLPFAPLIWWLLFTVACGSLLAIIRHQLAASLNGWRRYVAIGTVGSILSALYFYPVLHLLTDVLQIALLQISASLAWILLAAASFFRLRAGGTFNHDVLAERKALMTGTNLLLSPSVERKPTLLLRKPLWFRRSGRLFRFDDPSRILAESRIKAFLREFANVRLMLSFTAISSAAIVMTPVWLSIPLAFVLPGIAASWLHQQWKTWLAEPFIAQFPWANADTGAAARRSNFWLLAPSWGWFILLALWHALQ